MFTLTRLNEPRDKSTLWERLRLRGLSLVACRNEMDFEQIAESLGIPYPARSRQSRSTYISAITRESVVRYFCVAPDNLNLSLSSPRW